MKRFLLPLFGLACLCGSLARAQEQVQPTGFRPDLIGLDSGKLEAATPSILQPEVAKPLPEPQLPPEAHPWGRFPLGSWKQVRVIAEQLDARGKSLSSSVTETKTTLIEATDHDYTLKVEVTVQIEGKRFARPPQVTKLSYWGDLSEVPAGVRKVGTAEVELNGKRVACEIRQVVTEQQGQRRQSVVHFCSTLFPFVLKRESTITTAPEAKPQTTTVEVIASNLPSRVLGVVRNVAYVKTTRQLVTGSTLTMEIQSLDIPGGVVSHSAQELDDATIVTRRSTLELMDYGLGSESPEEATPSRKRWLRSRNRRSEEMAPPRR